MPKNRRSLTVYHIRNKIGGQKVENFEQMLRNPAEVRSFDLTSDMPFVARLFISKSEPRIPSWVAFLGECFGELPVSQTQSTSAILALRIPYQGGEEIFAFTFGFGRYLLHPNSFDRNYGLRTALNAIYEHIEGGNPINPNRIRSVSAMTITDNPIRITRQSDKKAAFGAFGMDIQRDLLNAITGMPMSSGAWGTRMSGADSLNTNPEIEFEGLGNYCKQIANTYRKDTYKQDFGFIENVKLVPEGDFDKELKEELATTLIEQPKAVNLTVPEIIEWEDIAYFRFSFDENEIGETFIDPDDADLNILGKKQPVSTELLKAIAERWYLEALSAQDEVEYSWPILKCLSFELRRRKKTYVLSDGCFWEIDQSFIEGLNRFVQALEETKPCPPACSSNKEGDYNSAVATGPTPFLYMDKRLVKIQDDQEKITPIEVCDLYTKDGCFIHVKWNHGSSSDLSHLFAQGSTSAVLFLNSKDYREAALSQMKKSEEERAEATGDQSFKGRFSTFNPDSIDPIDFEVSYAIIDEWDGKKFEKLPFFSKVTLRKNVDDLRRMGYKVTVACINIV